MAEVLVIGGGLAGCSVAWGLRRRGVSATVLERGPQLGGEASSQNAGMVRLLGEDPAERALAVRTHAYLASHPELATRTGGWLGLAHDAHHLHDAVAHVRAAGIRVEEAASPSLPALQRAKAVQGWWVPDALVADPHALLGHFTAGVDVGVRTEVVGLWCEGGRCVGVHTRQGSLGAEAVVLAGGAWSAGLARTAGLTRHLVPLRRHLLQSHPHEVSDRTHPWCWFDDAGVYARPEAGGWLVSGCDEAVDAPGPRGPVDPIERARVHQKLEQYFPALASIRFRGGWTGLRTFATDRRPLLGEDPELPGLWWAAGLGGFGVSCSVGVGEAVSAWLTGSDTPWLSPGLVSPARRLPARWPIRPTGSLDSMQLVEVAP